MRVRVRARGCGCALCVCVQLDLADNCITDRGGRAIADAIGANRKLHR
jgi:hypothetical protein